MRAYMMGLGLCLVTAPGVAQQPVAVSPGQRVWVRTRTSNGGWGKGVKGTATDIEDDSLVIEPEHGGSPVPFRLDDQTRVEISLGRRSAAGRGALIGGVGGVVAGALIGLAVYESCNSSGFLCATTRSSMVATGALLGGGVGLVAGAVLGAVRGREAWAPAARDHDLVRPVVVAGGLRWGAGIGISF